jgi:hypothetical protein
MYINNLLEDNSSNEVDHIVNKANDIFIQAANISIKIKTNINNKRNKSKRKARPTFSKMSEFRLSELSLINRDLKWFCQ